MALSEGLKGFFKMFTDGFQPNDGYDEDPFTDLVDGGYETDGQLALDTKESDLDAMYGTRVTSKPERSFGRESKVVSHPNSYKSGEVTVIEPRSFSESAQIVRKLIDKKTVILHLDLLINNNNIQLLHFVLILLYY